ncbi:PREDICTED: uncharacterized protein LOC105314740 [Amphimedon queenslandica]|uniref:Uncharacterized protein n=1 Tax=Amphimedon queenslandica TaxID=400682 RepID=A0AAN0JQ81_AMPQE|nr:PREDICTED: uncharacterized protein LOC105314740 [Amphimedon queenslandica]|eukprot:XP_019859206.1 PREDICTED: uncharacterized protein LOC105314740 [Amphimedon queenslandica]
MKMLYFLLLLFIGSFDVTSASCDCPSSKHTNLEQLENYYHQQGVPPNEKPTTAEQRFINSVVKYLKIDEDSNQSSGGNKGQEGAVAGSCQCTGHPGPTGSPGTGQKGERGPAGPTGAQGPPSGFDALAKYYAKYGRIEIVKFWAVKYLEHNVKPTSPPIGPQGRLVRRSQTLRFPKRGFRDPRDSGDTLDPGDPLDLLDPLHPLGLLLDPLDIPLDSESGGARLFVFPPEVGPT